MNIKSIAITATAALALSACGLTSTTEGSSDAEPTSGTNRPSDTSTAESTQEAEAEPEEEEELTGADPGVLTFGEAFTYSDGLQVNISQPSQMTSSEWAVPSGAQGLTFDVTIVNGTNKPYDPALDYFSAQIGNTEAEQIFDSEQGYDGTPSTKVLPDRESSFKVAFEGTDVDNLVMEYSPGDWDRGSLLFTPNGK